MKTVVALASLLALGASTGVAALLASSAPSFAFLFASVRSVSE